MSERHELPSGTSPALRARFDRLSSADQARVLARLGARDQDRDSGFHIPRRSERRAPLTYAQQGIWFRQQLGLESSAWNLSRTWTVSGPLDLTALERALSEIVRRHESLRTRYVVEGGDPIQEVMPAEPVSIERLDARESASGAGQAADFRGRLASRAFDLTLPVMVRAGVAILGPETHELTLTRHHICSDQWSSGIFRRELSTVYDDFVAGRAPSLADLRLQFNDFAWWERDAARSESTAAVLAEAIEALRGMPDESALAPTDGHASASGPGGRVTGAIPAPVVRGLRSLAHSHDATLFMVLMAIFNALVHRLTGQMDLVVVTPTAGRVHPHLESLIGQFANVLPLRTDLTGDPPFLDLLGRVQRGTTRLFAHQHVPIQRRQGALRPGWSGARMSTSSLLFALQNVPHDELRLTGVGVRPLESEAREVFEDLSLFATEDRDVALALRADYRADRVDESMVRHMLDDFAAIAAHVVDQPTTRLSELPMQARRPAIRPPSQWNDAATDYPRNTCVQELVERQVELTPDADAVIDGDTRVTYRELNMRANRLAHYLRAKGAAPDTSVGVCLGRSVDRVIALLGILKSGAAYTPLDATLPDQRLQFMLKESGAVIAVTSAELAHRLADSLVPVVSVDTDRSAIDEMRDGNPTRIGTAEDLAYVMFTSGSTGRPKGVAMPHRPLVNLLSWHARHPRLAQPARTLLFAPVSFDVSFQDIVATWCTGGTVVMIGDDTRRDPMALRRLLDEHAIERLYLPTAALNSLAQAHASSPRPLGRLRDIIAAGEALHVTPEIRRLASDAQECHLHNHYGPTETCVIVTAHELDGPAETWPAAVPIGRPLSNVHIEILNDDRRRAAAETEGELYIGGDCLARGYLGRPDLTAERFVDDPFRPGLRLYRTGDRGRRRPDGTLEFLGRLDDQPKVTGYRIEPGEVEAVMAECPGVRHAVVVVREDQPINKRLVGYYVAAAGAVTPGALQAHLRQRLPRYMVPAALIELTALPLSPNGKVDRAALPRPITDSRAREVVPPSDEVEASLVALWSDVFDRSGIGIDDNFFDLGGHSILAATMLLRAERAFGRAPGLNVLFERPTIRQLAHAFRGRGDQPARMLLTWITDAVPGDDRGLPPLVVTPSIFGAVDEWRTFFQGLDIDRPIFGLELLSGGSYWTDEPTMEDIAARCVEVLFRDFASRRFHLIGHSFGGRLAYELGRQLDAAGRAPNSIVIADTQTTDTPRPIGWRDLGSMMANAPGWLKNELQIYGASDLALRIRNRLRFRVRATKRGPEGIFEMSRFPEGLQRRMFDSHRAFSSYRGQPTGNRVVYLRSRVRPLIHRHRPDGGWGELVPASHLTVLPIPGDHGSLLFPRWRADVASTIQRALAQADGY